MGVPNGGQKLGGDGLEPFEDVGLGADWLARSVGHRHGHFGGCDQFLAAADGLLPNRRGAAELRDTGENDEVITGGCRRAETDIDPAHHELEALDLQHVEPKLKGIECINTPNLEVGDVHRVGDVVVGIQLVRSNSMIGHVLGHIRP